MTDSLIRRYRISQQRYETFRFGIGVRKSQPAYSLVISLFAGNTRRLTTSWQCKSEVLSIPWVNVKMHPCSDHSLENNPVKKRSTVQSVCYLSPSWFTNKSRWVAPSIGRRVCLPTGGCRSAPSGVHLKTNLYNFVPYRGTSSEKRNRLKSKSMEISILRTTI